MMQKDESNLPVEQTPPKKDLVSSAKDFVNGVLSPLKGRDVGQMVEEFTSEMTLVAEGLSEDQQALRQRQEALSAAQTEMEEGFLVRFREQQAENQALREQIKALREQEKALEKRLEKAEKSAADKKLKRAEGLTGVLRQATWLAAILAGAWVLTTIIRLFQ